MAKTVNLTAVEKLSTYNEHTNLIVEQEGELNRVAIADLKISDLPSVSEQDNGKFLRVVNGAWAVVSISNAEGVGF